MSSAVSDLMQQYTRREVAKATAAMGKTKRDLKHAEQKFEAEGGPENSSQLLDEIKKAEKRLALARVRLRDLHPD